MSFWKIDWGFQELYLTSGSPSHYLFLTNINFIIFKLPYLTIPKSELPVVVFLLSNFSFWFSVAWFCFSLCLVNLIIWYTLDTKIQKALNNNVFLQKGRFYSLLAGRVQDELDPVKTGLQHLVRLVYTPLHIGNLFSESAIYVYWITFGNKLLI